MYKRQEHFANDGHNSWKNTSPRQVGQYLLDRYMTKLNTYKFDKTECSTCAENTANNILFSDLAEGCAGCENRACMIRKNDEFLVEKAIRMQRNDPRTLLAVEVGRYSDAVLERLTSQGYTVEVIDTYSMWEPDVPVLPDVEAPRESDYEDRDEYLEALAEYESEVSEYRENMKKLDAEIDAGRVRKYALIGMLDVDLFYEEVPEQIEETSDDKGVTVYTSIAPRPIVEELESRIVMAHRSCYTQMTTDLKRVLRETEISSSALAASESRLYGYSLLRLLPSRYAEKLGLEREALQDVQQIGDFLDHLDGDRMNMLMRSVIFDCMDHIEEFRQTDETFELQLLRQFALQQDKETSERVIAEHLDRLEKTQSRLEEQLHALEQRKAQELAAEVEAFDPVVPEDPAVPDAVPAEDVPEPEGEPFDPDLWPEASASLAA